MFNDKHLTISVERKIHFVRNGIKLNVDGEIFEKLKI